MTAFLLRMPAGIPGNVSRAWQSTIEAFTILSTNPPTIYGSPIWIDAATGHGRPFVAGDLGSQAYGFYVRPFPHQGGVADAFGAGVAPTTGLGDVMVSGYMTVQLGGSTAATKNGQVYVWVGATSAPHIQGAVEAAPSLSASYAAKQGGNTGNGTIGTITPGANAQQGAYTLTMLTATTYNVYDPSGSEVGQGSTGSAFSSSELGFTVTAGGTAFVAGDGFVITVAGNTVKINKCVFMGPADSAGNVEIAYNL